jgi:hypothetical protein
VDLRAGADGSWAAVAGPAADAASYAVGG